MCTITHTRSHMYLIWRHICVSISWAGPVFGQVLEADSYPSPSRVTARRIQRKIKQVLCEKHCCHLQRFMHIWIGSASCQSAAGRPRIGSQLCARACTADGPILRVQPVQRWRGQSKLLCKHSHVCLKVLLSQAASVDSGKSQAFVLCFSWSLHLLPCICHSLSLYIQHGRLMYGRNQALKISGVWGGLKNCVIITPTNTTHYIHWHFKRDRHVDVCDRCFLCFGGMNIVKSYHIYCITIH